MESRFETDLAQEQLLQPYLDKSYIANGFEVSRTDKLDDQYDGVDLWLTRGGETIAVDEKAQLHFVGKSLPTFALEVEYFLDDERRTGWLYDSSKRTQAYAFVLDIRVADSSAALIARHAVTEANVILVDRKRLQMALLRDGLFRSEVEKQSERLRASGSRYRWIGTTGKKLVLSNHLAERPINLVVRRTFLERLGETLSEWSTRG